MVATVAYIRNDQYWYVLYGVIHVHDDAERLHCACILYANTQNKISSYVERQRTKKNDPKRHGQLVDVWHSTTTTTS